MTAPNKVPSFSLDGYTTVGKLGSGSYSTVYKAIPKNEKDKFVAVKCVEKSKLSSSGIDNIITEIQVMKLIHHEFIVEMKDFQWDDKFIYIILEYCGGGDLSSFIKKRKKLPERVFQKFMRQLALGLKFLRSKNICHLDLKPQNLLLSTTPTLTLKIADFGFAQFLTSDAQHTSIRGSPLYMAPEMLLKKQYDSKADLWSVGIISYECLFGKPPLPSATCYQLVEAIRALQPIEIPENSVSSECQSLLAGLLIYDPELRINFEEFFDHPFLDLEHYPSEHSYDKAVKLIHKAVIADTNKDYKEAFSLYCQALSYLVPYVNSLPDCSKKRSCYSKVLEYTKRAEEIKIKLFKLDESINLKKPRQHMETKTKPTRDSSDNESQLLSSLCEATPSMSGAVEIGYSAQMYLVEGNYQMALEKFETCLGILIPLLATEPSGIRRDLLAKQIQDWLKQAESVKALLSVNYISAKSHDSSEMCVLQ